MSAAATTQAPVSVHSIAPRQAPATTSALEAHRNALRAGPTLSYQAPSPSGSTSSSPILGPLDRRRSSARDTIFTCSSLGKVRGSAIWRSNSSSSTTSSCSSSSSSIWRRSSLPAANSTDSELRAPSTTNDEDDEDLHGQHAPLERRTSDESAASNTSFESNLWQRPSPKGSRGSSISNASSIATSPGLDDDDDLLGIAPEDLAAPCRSQLSSSSKLTPPASPRSVLASKSPQPTLVMLQRWPASQTDSTAAAGSTDIESLSISAQALRLGFVASSSSASDQPLASPPSLPGHSLHLPAAAIAARATTLVARRRGTMGGPSIAFDSWSSTSSGSSLISTSSSNARDSSARRAALRRPKTTASPQNHQGRRFASPSSFPSVVDDGDASDDGFAETDADLSSSTITADGSSGSEVQQHLVLADMKRNRSTPSMRGDVV